MAGLHGVLSPDLVRYVLRAYRPGWSRGARQDKMEEIARQLLAQAEESVVDRRVIQQLLAWGFTQEHVRGQVVHQTGVPIGEKDLWVWLAQPAEPRGRTFRKHGLATRAIHLWLAMLETE